MTQLLEASDLDTLMAALQDAALADAQLSILMDGHPVRFRFKRGIGDNLVILFHSVVNRERSEIPVFQSFPAKYLLQANVISIADPTIEAMQVVRASWYAGHEGFDSQGRIRELLEVIHAALSPRRTILMGGSSGGFASLYYGFYLPGSITITANPQTRLLHHYPRAVKTYHQECWPSCETIAEIGRRICTDVAQLYAKPDSNTVVYLQSSGDRHHIANHAVPFLAALHQDAYERLIFDCRFHGRPGHAASVPLAECWSWVSAVLLAKDLKPDTLLACRHEGAAQPMPPHERAAASSSPAPSNSNSVADAVSQWLLGAAEGRR